MTSKTKDAKSPHNAGVTSLLRVPPYVRSHKIPTSAHSHGSASTQVIGLRSTDGLFEAEAR